MISEHLKSWLGYPVQPLSFAEIEKRLPDLSKTVCRLYTGWESDRSFSELVERFLQLPGVERSPGLIIGAFTGDDPGADSAEAVRLLVAARSRLPALRGIFLGDIISEENEVSWICQCDVTPLLAAYPALEHFAVRGGSGLALPGLDHARLKSLTIQTGGLPSAVLDQIAAARLPSLEYLELWFGSDNYGWDGDIASVQPFLDPDRFPKLKFLGLKNSEIQDEIAAHVAGSAIVGQLEGLDLSMGTLTDAGAEALLANPALKRLEVFNLRHHYLTPAMEARLRTAFPKVNLSDRQEADEDGDETYRSIAVSE